MVDGQTINTMYNQFNEIIVGLKESWYRHWVSETQLEASTFLSHDNYLYTHEKLIKIVTFSHAYDKIKFTKSR